MTAPRTLLCALNIRAKKRLGQHFLADPSTAQMIVRRAQLKNTDTVLEIGAGLGALTIPTAQAVRRVFALEVDEALIPLLQSELLANRIENVTLINQNILNFDIEQLAHKSGGKLIVMGNLPYNISSQVIVGLVAQRAAVQRAVFMLQKELAQRVCAAPGCKAYGRLAVMVGYCARVRSLAAVKSTLFFPRTKVDSEVIEIQFEAVPVATANDETFFLKTVKAAFSQRRKTLKNGLTGSRLVPDPNTAQEILTRLEIEPNRRAETLSISEFVRLANALYETLSD